MPTSLTGIVGSRLGGDIGRELPGEVGQQHVHPLGLEHRAQLLLRLALPLPLLRLLRRAAGSSSVEGVKRATAEGSLSVEQLAVLRSTSLICILFAMQPL